MSNSNSSSKVPMGQKIAFGIGMLANQMFPAALGIFMVVLVQDLGFPGWMWGVIYFFPRLFDSFLDPIMGYISDNTKSKWGRRRPYVIIGGIITGIAFIAMWQLYKVAGVDYNFAYFMIWSFIFYLGITIFSVPYVAMGYEMSDDFHERTNIMAIAQWIGQWAWVIAPWFWVIMYDPEWFKSAEVATRSLAFWVGIIFAICAIIPGIFIKSKSTLEEDYSPLNIKNIGSSLREIGAGFMSAFKMKPFRQLCIATFLVYNAFMTIASFSFFIIVYKLFDGNAGAAGIWPTLFGCLGALGTTFFVIPIVTRMSKKMGKKKAFIISQGISIVGYLMLWFLFIPGKPYMFIFALPFFSFGIGSLFLLMMSMTADVIDLDELNTGLRREGTFGAIYWLMVKFGFAIAGGLSGVIMTTVGFDSGSATQPEGAVDGLRLAFSGIPVVGTIIAMYVMRNYNVTEESAGKVREELTRRKEIRNAPKISSGYAAGNLFPLVNNIILKEYAGVNFSNLEETEIRTLFSESLNNGLKGLCFSPYIEGQDANDVLSELQISRRMDIINPYAESVRSFSCTNGNELIPQIAKQKGLKTLVGAWISSDKKRNEKEIEGLIRLAKSGFVDIAAVGNEVLLRGDLSEKEMIAYMIRVKNELKELNIPVGCVDTYYEYSKRPKLVEISDIILTNCYPFWEGSSIENSLTQLRQIHAIIQKAANGKRIIITETGWPSQGDAVQKADPTKLNAMKYFIQTQEWGHKEEVEIFHFSSFDESWKVKTEGELGARWGIWDKDEKPKYS